MMGFIKSNIVGLIALFVALGGTAVALGTGEVKSKHVAKNAVKPKQLAPNSVRSPAIKDRSIRPRDLSPAITSGQGAPGLVGPPGKDLEFRGKRIDGPLTRRVPAPVGQTPPEIPLGSFAGISLFGTCAVATAVPERIRSIVSVRLPANLGAGMVGGQSGIAGSLNMAPGSTRPVANLLAAEAPASTHSLISPGGATLILDDGRIFDVRVITSAQRTGAATAFVAPGPACGYSVAGIELVSE